MSSCSICVGSTAATGSGSGITVTSDYRVIIGSRLLAGLGFGLAYPTLNIQALTGVRDDEQGLASGLVGSSFQIGGAIVLAVTTALILAQTPADATSAQTVHAFTAGVYGAVASACLLMAIAIAGWRSDRRRKANEPRRAADAPEAEPVRAELLDLAA